MTNLIWWLNDDWWVKQIYQQPAHFTSTWRVDGANFGRVQYLFWRFFLLCIDMVSSFSMLIQSLSTPVHSCHQIGRNGWKNCTLPSVQEHDLHICFLGCYKAGDWLFEGKGQDMCHITAIFYNVSSSLLIQPTLDKYKQNCQASCTNWKKGEKNCIAQALSAAAACLQNDSWQLPLRGWSNVGRWAWDRNCWLWLLRWPCKSCKVVLIGTEGGREIEAKLCFKCARVIIQNRSSEKTDNNFRQPFPPQTCSNLNWKLRISP